jgi:hypothetical protein
MSEANIEATVEVVVDSLRVVIGWYDGNAVVWFYAVGEEDAHTMLSADEWATFRDKIAVAFTTIYNL